jgi:hypothetical protein
METVMPLNRKLQQQQNILLHVWIFLRFFPAMSVLLDSDTILTVLETLVFSIQLYQLYAYPIFWAWVAGSLIWARFSSKISNAAPYPREAFNHAW